MSPDTQEVRNQTVGASVTPTEKRFVELTATMEKKPVSQLLREFPLDVLIERGRDYATLIDTIQSAA